MSVGVPCAPKRNRIICIRFFFFKFRTISCRRWAPSLNLNGKNVLMISPASATSKYKRFAPSKSCSITPVYQTGYKRLKESTYSIYTELYT